MVNDEAVTPSAKKIALDKRRMHCKYSPVSAPHPHPQDSPSSLTTRTGWSPLCLVSCPPSLSITVSARLGHDRYVLPSSEISQIFRAGEKGW